MKSAISFFVRTKVTPLKFAIIYAFGEYTDLKYADPSEIGMKCRVASRNSISRIFKLILFSYTNLIKKKFLTFN